MRNARRASTLICALAGISATGGCVQAPSSVEQVPVASDAPTTPLAGTQWRLTAWQAEGLAVGSLGEDELYTLEFAADGAVGGHAHCNRFFGRYETGPGNVLSMRDLGATLVACAPPSRSSEYLRAVERATTYTVEGAALSVSFGAGGLLTFESQARGTMAAPSRETGRTFVFDCTADVSFTVRTGPGEVALWTPAVVGGEYLVLSQTPAASGARYQEGATVFWDRGELAMFEVAGQRYVDCRSNPAKVPWADAARRGITFRALGNEPGWNLEVQPEQPFVLVTEYGARRTAVPYVAPIVDGARTTYRAAGDGHELTIVIERRACTDTMSGDAFEGVVTVTLDGTTLRGCGRWL